MDNNNCKNEENCCEKNCVNEENCCEKNCVCFDNFDCASEENCYENYNCVNDGESHIYETDLFDLGQDRCQLVTYCIKCSFISSK